MQQEITESGLLLDPRGELKQVGWARSPLLMANLERASFYPRLFRPFQSFRMKKWDYYAVFTPKMFFSATIAHLGYAGNIFVYVYDYENGKLHEEGVVPLFGRGVQLAETSINGESVYEGKGVKLHFRTNNDCREVLVDWPAFHEGRGIQAALKLIPPPGQESMTIVIPIEKRRFYYNQKINCLPVEGRLKYGEDEEILDPSNSLGSLDWGRGVWAYRSFWNWASASGRLQDGRLIGLNFGSGFGDTSAATENCILVDGRVHKLDQVLFNYNPGDYLHPWIFKDNQRRIELKFVPIKERIAQTDLKIIFSQVHQMFGYYSGRVQLDEGEEIQINDLFGFAEEHHARW